MTPISNSNVPDIYSDISRVEASKLLAVNQCPCIRELADSTGKSEDVASLKVKKKNRYSKVFPAPIIPKISDIEKKWLNLLWKGSLEDIQIASKEFSSDFLTEQIFHIRLHSVKNRLVSPIHVVCLRDNLIEITEIIKYLFTIKPILFLDDRHTNLDIWLQFWPLSIFRIMDRHAEIYKPKMIIDLLEHGYQCLSRSPEISIDKISKVFDEVIKSLIDYAIMKNNIDLLEASLSYVYFQDLKEVIARGISILPNELVDLIKDYSKYDSFEGYCIPGSSSVQRILMGKGESPSPILRSLFGILQHVFYIKSWMPEEHNDRINIAKIILKNGATVNSTYKKALTRFPKDFLNLLASRSEPAVLVVSMEKHREEQHLKGSLALEGSFRYEYWLDVIRETKSKSKCVIS